MRSRSLISAAIVCVTIELAERLIEAFTDKTKLVVDPYVGAGSEVTGPILVGRLERSVNNNARG